MEKVDKRLVETWTEEDQENYAKWVAETCPDLADVAEFVTIRDEEEPCLE